MDNAMLVGIAERAADIPQYIHNFCDGKRPALQAMSQRFAIDERHREVRQTIGVAGRKYRDDVGLAQRRSELDFALEPLDRKALREFRRDDLDHYATPQPGFFGDIDPRHATTAEFAVDDIL